MEVFEFLFPLIRVHSRQIFYLQQVAQAGSMNVKEVAEEATVGERIEFSFLVRGQQQVEGRLRIGADRDRLAAEVTQGSRLRRDAGGVVRLDRRNQGRIRSCDLGLEGLLRRDRISEDGSRLSLLTRGQVEQVSEELDLSR